MCRLKSYILASTVIGEPTKSSQYSLSADAPTVHLYSSQYCNSGAYWRSTMLTGYPVPTGERYSSQYYICTINFIFTMLIVRKMGNTLEDACQHRKFQNMEGRVGSARDHSKVGVNFLSGT